MTPCVFEAPSQAMLLLALLQETLQSLSLSVEKLEFKIAYLLGVYQKFVIKHYSFFTRYISISPLFLALILPLYSHKNLSFTKS